MMKKNRKGFTLIELLAVLVVLAILALITTPIVLNIIKNAREEANKRSADAYVRAVENAVTNCMTKYPNIDITTDGKLTLDVNNKIIKYNNIECSTVDYKGSKQVTANGSLIIKEKDKKLEIDEGTTEFIIGNHTFYVYKGQANESEFGYNLGDLVKYNGIYFRVLKENKDSKSITLLKEEPLTSQQTRNYGSTSTYETSAGYGGAYFKQDSSSTDYNQSDIKNVVEKWAKAELNSSDLVADSNGYKVRLLTYEELVTSLGYDVKITSADVGLAKTDDVPDWVYNSDYSYWTMSPYKDSSYDVWNVYGSLGGDSVYNSYRVVRPVITVLKSKVQ